MRQVHRAHAGFDVFGVLRLPATVGQNEAPFHATYACIRADAVVTKAQLRAQLV